VEVGGARCARADLEPADLAELLADSERIGVDDDFIGAPAVALRRMKMGYDFPFSVAVQYRYPFSRKGRRRPSP